MMRHAVSESKERPGLGPRFTNPNAAIQADVCDGGVEHQSLAQGLEKTIHMGGLDLDSTTSEKATIRYLK